MLVLSFLLFPLADRFRHRIQIWDVIPCILAVGIMAYALYEGDDFTDRAVTPTKLDVVLGVIFIVLVLEAARRTTGWIMPFVAVLFVAYAYYGPYLPPPDPRRLHFHAPRRTSLHHA